MPNQPKTLGRVVRMDDALWSAVKDRAAEDEVSASDVVRAAVAVYVMPPPPLP